MEIKTFPGIVDSLEPIRLYVQSEANNAGIDKKAVYKLLIAIDEISTNIVLHGYEDAGLYGNLDVSMDIKDNRFIVTFEDSAMEFNPLEHDLPTEDDLSLPLEERPIGGLGIYLTLKGVDEFKYEYVNNRNRNIFILNIPEKV